RDCQANASLVAGGNAVLQLLPRRAGVGGLVDRAARTAAVEAERFAEPLIRRGVEDFGVAWIHHDVGRAGVGIDEERLAPGAAGVRGFGDAARGVGGPEVADRGDVGDVRIGGIEHDASDRARVVQAEVGPRAAGVGGAVDAAAPRRALAIVVLAAAGPDDLRVAFEDRERAEGVVGLTAEDIGPGDALVGRLPDAAGGRGDVDDRGILRVDLQVVD